MANNYVSFSVAFKLPQAAAEDLEKIIAATSDNDGFYELNSGYPYWFTEQMCNMVTDSGAIPVICSEFEAKDPDSDGNVRVWAADYDNSPYALAQALHLIMKHHKVPGEICMCSSYTCDKLRVDNFGGEAYNVSGKGMYVLGTQVLARILPRIQKAINKALEASK